MSTKRYKAEQIVTLLRQIEVKSRTVKLARKLQGNAAIFAQINAFSKTLENHVAALSVYSMYYNFCRVHQTLRVTPTMEASIADHVWGVEQIIRLLGKT